ncbi:unnamed protein product, partial [Symbiodinium microadriaticum]
MCKSRSRRWRMIQKEHWRKLTESELELDRANYKSAEMSSAELLDKFRAEEKLGRMVPTTTGALLSEYKEDEIRVASMGAISKPDGSVRPLHDGTHGVQVNNHIHLVNQLAVPGPAEMAFSARQSGAMQEVPLAATADVSAAHRLVLHGSRNLRKKCSIFLVEPPLWDHRGREADLVALLAAADFEAAGADSVRTDCTDPDRPGIHVDNVPFYYNRYFRKTFAANHYGFEANEKVIDLVKDTVSLGERNMLTPELGE